MADPELTTIDKGPYAVYRSKRQLMAANFLGGIAWGFGTVMGATILVALVLFLLQVLGGLPLIGSYINAFTEAVTSTRR
jgi:hypothetical protein